jgi:predicted nucleotidyltransferase
VEAKQPLRAVHEAAAKYAGLEMLVLFGSRARGDATVRSDWDFGYIASSQFDPAALLGDLVLVLGTDDVDLVDLSSTGGLLRYSAARDGRLVWGHIRTFERFWLEAVDFWCDTEPILRSAYQAVLAEL